MKRKAFTLVELLVVIVVMVILIGIMLPVIKGMTRNNNRKQAVNLVTTMIAQARGIAIKEGRQAGVIFFEESAQYANPRNPNQTCMQFIVEDRNQAQYAKRPENTVFIHHSTARQYFPLGIMVGVLNDDPAKMVMTGSGSGGQSRVILFDSKGQMILRNGIARPDLGSGAAGTYPRAYGDWKLTTKAGDPFDGVSSPGLMIFGKKDYEQFLSLGTPTDQQKSDWIQQNTDVLIVNAITGNIIR